MPVIWWPVLSLIKGAMPTNFQAPSLSLTPQLLHHPQKLHQHSAKMVRESKPAPHGFISLEEFIRTRDSGRLHHFSARFHSIVAIFSQSHGLLQCFLPRRVILQSHQHMPDTHIYYDASPCHATTMPIASSSLPLTCRPKAARQIFAKL